MSHEGVIQFEAEHEQRELETRRYGELACELIAWREIMALTGLVGQEPGRYEGAGYGNVSARVGPRSAAIGRRSFLITGSQTSGNRCIGLGDFAVVDGLRLRGEPGAKPRLRDAFIGVHDACRRVRREPARPLRAPRTQSRAVATQAGAGPSRDGSLRTVRHTARWPWRWGVCTGRPFFPNARSSPWVATRTASSSIGRNAEEAGGVLLRWLARAYGTACGEGDGGICST